MILCEEEAEEEVRVEFVFGWRGWSRQAFNHLLENEGQGIFSNKSQYLRQTSVDTRDLENGSYYLRLSGRNWLWRLCKIPVVVESSS